MNSIAITRIANGYLIRLTPADDGAYDLMSLMFGRAPSQDAEPMTETQRTWVAKTWEEAVDIAGRFLAGTDIPAAFREMGE